MVMNEKQTLLEMAFNLVMWCVVLSIVAIVDGPKCIGRVIDATMEEPS
jgi:hypothetical protein